MNRQQQAELLKIKEPVIIKVFRGRLLRKIRILFPSGDCYWALFDEDDISNKPDVQSCFVENRMKSDQLVTLENTVRDMIEYDNGLEDTWEIIYDTTNYL